MKDCQFGVSPVNYSDSDSDSDLTRGLAEEDKSLALTREVNLDTQSSDSSAEEQTLALRVLNTKV